MVRRTILLVLLMVSSVAASAQKGRLDLRVHDPANALVGDAMIRIEHWVMDGDTPVLTEDLVVRRGPESDFKIDLKPGSYDVTVTAREWDPVARRITIEKYKTTVADFLLQRPITETLSK